MKKITEITTEREFVSKLRIYYRKSRRKGYQRNEISFLGLMEYVGSATSEFEYQSEKYFSVGIRAYDWVHGNYLLSALIDKWENEIEVEKRDKQPATPTETPRISTEASKSANVSVEGEKEAERPQYRVWRFAKPNYAQIIVSDYSQWKVVAVLSFVWGKTQIEVSDDVANIHTIGKKELTIDKPLTELTDAEVLELIYNHTEPPQSPETPQTVERTTDTPKPRETARKPQNRGIGSAQATRRNTLRDTLRPVTYVPRECSTADAAHW